MTSSTFIASMRPPARPRLLILHGLEGTVRSHYAGGLLHEAQRRGWAADLLIFRSCGDEPNRALRLLPLGRDLRSRLRRASAHRRRPGAPSLHRGRLARRQRPAQMARRAGRPCAPTAARCRGRLGAVRSRARLTISRPRLLTLVPGALSPLAAARKRSKRAPGFRDAIRAEVVRRARTLYDFDDLVTAPVHGFRDADDYYTRSSSLHLSRARSHPHASAQRARRSLSSARRARRGARDRPHESVAPPRVRRAWRTRRLHLGYRCRGDRSTTRSGEWRIFWRASQRLRRIPAIAGEGS